MILAHLHGSNAPSPIRVDHVVNRGGWFGKRWLVHVGMGFEGVSYLIEAESEGDAIDCLADSRHAHVIATDPCDACRRGDWNTCGCDRAGNDAHPVNLDNLTIWKVTRVEWFARKGE